MVLAFPSGLDYLPVNCGGIFGRGFGENIFILGGGKRGGIMKIIKNSEGLAKLVSKDKDLILDEDIRIEFEPTKTEFRDVKCRNLFLMNDNQRFDFNGRNFNGGNFTGRNFTGRAVTYYAFFNCYSSIKCESITGRRNPCHLPICLEGKLEIIKR